MMMMKMQVPDDDVATTTSAAAFFVTFTVLVCRNAYRESHKWSGKRLFVRQVVGKASAAAAVAAAAADKLQTKKAAA